MWGETGIIRTIKNFTARQYNCRYLLGVRKEYVNYQMFQKMGWGEQMAVVNNLYKVIRRKTRASRQTKSEADGQLGTSTHLPSGSYYSVQVIEIV